MTDTHDASDELGREPDLAVEQPGEVLPRDTQVAAETRDALCSSRPLQEVERLAHPRRWAWIVGQVRGERLLDPQGEFAPGRSTHGLREGAREPGIDGGEIHSLVAERRCVHAENPASRAGFEANAHEETLVDGIYGDRPRHDAYHERIGERAALGVESQDHVAAIVWQDEGTAGRGG